MGLVKSINVKKCQPRGQNLNNKQGFAYPIKNKT